MPTSWLEQDLGFLLARTQRAMRRWLMARLEPIGLTYEQFRVLNALCEEDTVSQATLAERACMDVTSLARMLDRMEHAGLIRRETSPSDSRINLVVLTDKSRALAGRFGPVRDQGLERATEGLAEKEVRQLRNALNAVFNNMNE